MDSQLRQRKICKPYFSGSPNVSKRQLNTSEEHLVAVGQNQVAARRPLNNKTRSYEIGYVSSSIARTETKLSASRSRISIHLRSQPAPIASGLPEVPLRDPQQVPAAQDDE